MQWALEEQWLILWVDFLVNYHKCIEGQWIGGKDLGGVLLMEEFKTSIPLNLEGVKKFQRSKGCPGFSKEIKDSIP
ncbi:MAG: hypothetical protein L0Y56_01765 [Nitrospira sp.]|nr:hypothetical protein [Nitrospira sp.]